MSKLATHLLTVREEANTMTDRPTCLRVAASSGVDPRTVARYLAGDGVAPASAMVIADALRRLGMSELVRAGAGPQGRDGLGGGKVRA